MHTRIINLRVSKAGRKIGYAVISPSIEGFLAGAKTRLVRFVADETTVVGESLDLTKWRIGQTDALPPRKDGQPSSFSEITWLDKV